MGVTRNRNGCQRLTVGAGILSLVIHAVFCCPSKMVCRLVPAASCCSVAPYEKPVLAKEFGSNEAVLDIIQKIEVWIVRCLLQVFVIIFHIDSRVDCCDICDCVSLEITFCHVRDFIRGSRALKRCPARDYNKGRH